MTQWYVKDLSKLTGVSVQTLHHYDRIGLLKPSARLDSGYRLYSEKDLLKLQQIVALKFFGFELSRIKTLLESDVAIHDHFCAQARFLEEKAKTLLEASQTLKSVIAECDENKSVPWETIIKMIEVYRMTQQLEKSWEGKVLTPEELKQYARFEEELKTRFTEADQKAFEKTWAALVAQIQANLSKDPQGEIGIKLGQQVMDLINGLYGKEHANLKQSIWEKGFKQGKMDEEHALKPEVVTWLDQAIDAYYRGRIYSILDKVETSPSAQVAKEWNALLDEMYGNNEQGKQELIATAMKETRINDNAKKWLQQFKQA